MTGNGLDQHVYPFVTVGGLIVAPDGDVLLVSSKKWMGLYTVPGGKVERGETREAAFIREVKEETNLDVGEVRFALVQDSIFSKEFYHPNHFVMNDYIARLSHGCTKEDVVLNEEAEDYLWISPEEGRKMSLTKETATLLDWYIANKGLEK